MKYIFILYALFTSHLFAAEGPEAYKEALLSLIKGNSNAVFAGADGEALAKTPLVPLKDVPGAFTWGMYVINTKENIYQTSVDFDGNPMVYRGKFKVTSAGMVATLPDVLPPNK